MSSYQLSAIYALYQVFSEHKFFINNENDESKMFTSITFFPNEVSITFWLGNMCGRTNTLRTGWNCSHRTEAIEAERGHLRRSYKQSRTCLSDRRIRKHFVVDMYSCLRLYIFCCYHIMLNITAIP